MGQKICYFGNYFARFLGIILRVRADGWSYPGASEASKIFKNRQQRRMRIGELARTVDVNVETIRYYQRIGLVELPEKPYGSMRSYSDQDLQRLRFIRRAQQLGFSLEDIRQLLELSSSDCERVEELAAQKLSEAPVMNMVFPVSFISVLDDY